MGDVDPPGDRPLDLGPQNLHELKVSIFVDDELSDLRLVEGTYMIDVAGTALATIEANEKPGFQQITSGLIMKMLGH